MLVFLSSNYIINLIINIILYGFLFIIFLSVFLLVLLLLSTLKVQIKYNKENYKLVLKLYIFSKIRYFKIEIDKHKLKKILKKVKVDMEKVNIYKLEKSFLQDRKVVKNIIEKIDINIEYLKLDMKIGTEFILLTSVIIITLSTIFPYLINKFIKKYNAENYMYKFTPIYNKNDINIQLNCIINIKLIHIINVIISIIFKKGVFKNVRTSDTRFNDNCYE